MKTEYRNHILLELKDGEQRLFHKSKLKWRLGKPLSYGITPLGFPFIVWENKDFATIQVGLSRFGDEPISLLRNDTCNSICLTEQKDRMYSAIYMSKQIAY